LKDVNEISLLVPKILDLFAKKLPTSLRIMRAPMKTVYKTIFLAPLVIMLSGWGNTSVSYRCQKEDLLVILNGYIQQTSPQQNGWDKYKTNDKNFLKVVAKDRPHFFITDFAGDKPSTKNYEVIGSKADLQGPFGLILQGYIRSISSSNGVSNSFYMPANFYNLNNFIFYWSTDKDNLSIKTKGVCYKE